MGVPYLNDLAVDGTLNTNKQTNRTVSKFYAHLYGKVSKTTEFCFNKSCIILIYTINI